MENCFVEKEKVLRDHTARPINIITRQKPKNNSTDESKSNREQQQNQHGDRLVNSYETLMAEIIELKGFVMEELHDINKHFTDLPSGIDLVKYDKEVDTLREDCAPKNYIIKNLVENLPRHTNSFYKVNQENNNPSYTNVNSQNDQPFVSPKRSNKMNSTNTDRS